MKPMTLEETLAQIRAETLAARGKVPKRSVLKIAKEDYRHQQNTVKRAAKALSDAHKQHENVEAILHLEARLDEAYEKLQALGAHVAKVQSSSGGFWVRVPGGGVEYVAKDVP